jgi:hypothetical protein
MLTIWPADLHRLLGQDCIKAPRRALLDRAKRR